MNRRGFLAGVTGLAAAGVACSQGPRLNVYNWSDYIAADTVTNFEREFGVRVRYATYESGEEMLAQVMSGNSGWDVVFPAADFIGPMRDLGLLAELHPDLLPNRGALQQTFAKPPWDPELRWAIPYMHGATGILYQKALVPAPQTWSNLWDPGLSGKITMLDDSVEVFAACLRKLEYSINSSRPAELAAARDEAIRQKPLLRAYLNAEVRDQAIAGDVVAAQAWTVTAAQAIAAAPGRLAFAFPQEGFPRFADNIAILRESRRVEMAHQWMNYLLRPEVAAAIAMTARASTTNGEALALLPPEAREDPVLYPTPETYQRSEWLEPHSVASQKLRDRLWTEIKSAS